MAGCGAVRLAQVKLNARIFAPPDSASTRTYLRDGVEFVLLMDLFAVPLRLDNQYLFIERQVRSRCVGEHEKDDQEKREEGQRWARGIANKWSAYLFGEKTNLCIGQKRSGFLCST